MSQINLTSRESETLQQLMEGRSNKEIASSLCVCEKTVEFHLGNLYAKIGVRTRTEAVVWALRSGLAQEG